MNTTTLSKVRLHFRTPGTRMAGAISYAIGACAYGPLLVARGDDGVCAIFMDDAADRLREQLVQAFPGNALKEAEVEMQHDLAQVIAFIDAPETDTRLDLSVGGTLFQQRVWTALCGIPAGQTNTYTEVAQGIGAPDAVRAVASACAANVLAVAIPCHRVVGKNGKLTGYRWGIERKRDLLLRERHAPQP